MKKVGFILTLLLFCIVNNFSQSLENSLLWKVSGNGLEKPSYLFGTFHLLCPEDLNITEKTKEAISNCEQLVLELDFDDPQLMSKLQLGMFMTDGKTVKDYLSEEEYTKVAEFFTKNMGVPFQQIHMIKPFFLSSMTLLFFLDCQPVSIEQEFSSIATKQGKEVIGLETVEQQLQFIDTIPVEDAVRMLVLGIEEVEEGKNMTMDLVETYLEGDLEGIQKILDTSMAEEYGDINDRLLISRNYDWVPKIETIIQEKSSFIAFGAGHLTGGEGVIKLLRKEGYTVEANK